MPFSYPFRLLVFGLIFSFLCAGKIRAQMPGEDLTGPPRPLSLAECIEIALDTNPALQAARFGVDAAEEAVGAARSPYYPQVDAVAGFHRWDRTIFLPAGLERSVPETIGETDEWSGGVSAWYTLYDSGKRRAELLSAQAEAGASAEEALQVRQDIVLLVEEAYFHLLGAIAAKAAAQESLERSEKHFDSAQKRFEAGDVPKADVLRSRVDLADARLTLTRQENLLRIARSELNAAMGLYPALPVRIEAEYPDPVNPEQIDLAWALQEAIGNRPEFEKFVRLAEVARHRVEAVEGRYGPRINAEGRYGRRDDEFLPEAEDWSAGVSLSIPLFTGFERTHRVAEAEALEARRRAEKNRVALQVQQEVVATISKLEEAFQAVETTDVMVIDARESLRLIETRYEVRAATMTDLLAAEAALAEAESRHVQALAERQIASARFLRALGKLGPRPSHDRKTISP